ncbi:MAG: hypothetical protein KKF89_03310, partial [Nanoarchaeota archaeon]|nr:hypothetical protein [Nanoarchaeota archaeon]
MSLYVVVFLTLFSSPVSSLNGTAYIMLAGRPIVEISEDQVLHFYITDAFNSPITVINSTRDVEYLTEYYPFGEEAYPVMVEEKEQTKKFKGVTYDGDSKLYEGSAYDSNIGRYFTPKINRLLSPTYNLQKLNVYTY